MMRRNLIRADIARAIACATAVAVAAGCACENRIEIESDTGGSDDAGVDTGISDSMFAWDPPIDNLGETGWRESTVPFCMVSTWRLEASDVWSDSHGVFAIVQEMNPGPGIYPPPTPDMASGRHFIALNDGTGWRRYIEDIDGPVLSECMYELTGIPGGNLFIIGMHAESCHSAPIAEGPIVVEFPESYEVFPIGGSLMYSLHRPDLLEYFDGSSWGPYPPAPLPYSMFHIWANDAAIFLGGDDGLILSEDGDTWRVHDTGTTRGILALWGFDESDVWAGISDGSLIHWDGTSWTAMAWPSRTESQIQGMWGADGILFFHDGYQVVQWDGVAFTSILSFPVAGQQQVRAIWGNSPEELFIAVADGSVPDDVCNTMFMLWWDGAEFHWF